MAHAVDGASNNDTFVTSYMVGDIITYTIHTMVRCTDWGLYGSVLAWLFGRIAYKKLERNGPELLFEMKSGMKINSDNYKKKIRNKEMELPKKKLAVVILLVFMGIFFLVHQSIVPIVFEIFDVDERVRLFFFRATFLILPAFL